MVPAVMGIVNVTPDSFSDGAMFATAEDAVARGARLVDEGADLVDVGGESTRPGSDPVEVDEELRRVVPVIEGLAKARPGTPISIDTRKPKVAIAALDAGACVVNDITAGRDTKLLEIVARTGAGIVLMHMLGEPKTMQDDPRYDDVVAEVNEFLRERIEAAVFAGIPEERTCIDPGIGFGKTVEHNLALLRAVPALRMLGAAVMVGASRKGFIGTLTGVEDPAARFEGSLAVAVLAAAYGADLVRVHDVEATVRALKVADAVVREPFP
ncbi:MAG: dihydropteroate synthase [Actinobacteria bacterium]|nr:MAG: dihydropteroate synthase [Actinomycetota bacterium]